MNRAIYPILSGALAEERQLQVFANNLANVNTAGFKQDEQAFRTVLGRAGHAPAASLAAAGLAQTIMTKPAGSAERVFVQPHALATSFEAGRIRITGNPLDLAVDGNGFFEVKTPQGPRYTRSGMFSLDNKRRLVSNLGYPVMGTKGEIKIPPGNIQINNEGVIQVDGNQVATLKVVEFAPGQMPQKHMEGLFSGGKPKTASHPRVQSGHIEESNVNALSEMVKMIQGMRSYESAQKLMQTLDQMTETAIRDVGRVQ
ncbi:MAG TPA: flagellar basal-body rod protein FlgF [Nitrospiraceae bacterium]|nr:flagellar basal-body rod protein FlgF [Nitrospiraceae bacterium]